MKRRCYINYVIYFSSSLQDIKKFENLQNHSFCPIASVDSSWDTNLQETSVLFLCGMLCGPAYVAQRFDRRHQRHSRYSKHVYEYSYNLRAMDFAFVEKRALSRAD